jgi:hypothetical protein
VFTDIATKRSAALPTTHPPWPGSADDIEVVDAEVVEPSPQEPPGMGPSYFDGGDRTPADASAPGRRSTSWIKDKNWNTQERGGGRGPADARAASAR